jgi:hypothetical protein
VIGFLERWLGVLILKIWEFENTKKGNGKMENRIPDNFNFQQFYFQATETLEN